MSNTNTNMVGFERSAGESLSEQARQDLEALAAMSGGGVDFFGIRPLPWGWSKTVKRFGEVYKAHKEAISLRLDSDVLLWLRAGGG